MPLLVVRPTVPFIVVGIVFAPIARTSDEGKPGNDLVPRQRAVCSLWRVGFVLDLIIAEPAQLHPAIHLDCGLAREQSLFPRDRVLTLGTVRPGGSTPRLAARVLPPQHGFVRMHR